ncbi:hypothetical protein LN042_28215 [Kitasatospora sp. RB6PN24]|uniref:hypothetical protein n=1 Tax=Kitasatospora humi TaxID=2893891 RepID=UPI001E3312D3|nr:hypothetical protein [Kitasatospora humi]MCC9310910.1 hypothetical protein [Kitasatospora humi]
MSSRDDRTTTPAGRQLLVLADRDAAEEVAGEMAERWPELGPFELVRDALAGEDDAEDAQWLVVLEEPAEGWAPAVVAAVDALVAEHEGWREDG